MPLKKCKTKKSCLNNGPRGNAVTSLNTPIGRPTVIRGTPPVYGQGHKKGGTMALGSDKAPKVDNTKLPAKGTASYPSPSSMGTFTTSLSCKGKYYPSCFSETCKSRVGLPTTNGYNSDYFYRGRYL
jgi:hypothetical protein